MLFPMIIGYGFHSFGLVSHAFFLKPITATVATTLFIDLGELANEPGGETLKNVGNKLGGTICIVDSRNESPLPSNSDADVEAEGGDDPAVTPKPDAHKEKDPNRAFELANNFKSSVERSALQFNVPSAWQWPDRNKLPDEYHPDPVDGVAALVSKSAGTGKLFVK